MSCARVKQCSAASIGATERHNERLNTDYANVNVVQERIPLNVHYRSPPSSYMDTLRTMETAGTVSTRGLRKDATLFDEIIIDVNTMYFERNGGYEYAKKFYEEAYHFLEKKFGSEYVVAAVMHADEINKAATSDLGKDVYHYHLHAVVIPVVDKDILWSKRCKDPALRGTVRETIHQVSHSKKWASNIPLKDEQGQPVLRSNGKPKYRPSYSILQDELVTHMQEHGLLSWARMAAAIRKKQILFHGMATMQSWIFGFGIRGTNGAARELRSPRTRAETSTKHSKKFMSRSNSFSRQKGCLKLGTSNFD